MKGVILFLLGVVLGAAVGALTALLLTPYSGDELRRQIGERSSELGGQFEQITERGRIVLQENVKKAQEAVQEAQARLSQVAAEA
ncbi:MAG: YtxH domain-containing protein [Anaerolineae bacterium]|nr:YtxH domain-containing protein [Anaerolineae bacterium]